MCEKIGYPSEKRARECINMPHKKYSKRNRSKSPPKRAYYCKECGYYHLTSSPVEFYHLYDIGGKQRSQLVPNMKSK